MKTHRTIPDKGYIITVAVAPCNVSAVMEDGTSVLLLTAQQAGQYGFVSLSSQISVSDDEAVVTEADYSIALVGAKQEGEGLPDNAALRDQPNVFAQRNTFDDGVILNAEASMPNARPASNGLVTENTLLNYLIDRDMKLAELRDERLVYQLPGAFTAPLKEGDHAAKTISNPHLGVEYSSYWKQDVSGRWESRDGIFYPQQSNVLAGEFNQATVLFTGPKILTLSKAKEGDYSSISIVSDTAILGIRLICRSGLIMCEFFSSDQNGNNEVIYSSERSKHFYYGYPTAMFSKLWKGETWRLAYEGRLVDCGVIANQRLEPFRLRLELLVNHPTEIAFGGGRGAYVRSCITYAPATRNALSESHIPARINQQYWGTAPSV